MPFPFLLAMAVAAVATPEAVTADVRCMVAASSLVGSGDKAVAGIGYFSSMFWLGRLGDISEKELDRQMTEQGLHMTAADISIELQCCGVLMKERGDMLGRVGASLTRKSERLETR